MRAIKKACKFIKQVHLHNMPSKDVYMEIANMFHSLEGFFRALFHSIWLNTFKLSGVFGLRGDQW